MHPERIILLINIYQMAKFTKDDVQISWNHGGGRMHLFSVSGSISKEEACELQMQLGYHPAGYGFYAFDPTITLTTWKCSDSCD
jgi:hypothetical protein